MFQIKDKFILEPSFVHLSLSLVTSHPKEVRDAIDKYRNELDKNPTLTYRKNEERLNNVLKQASLYFNAPPEEFALTESTTMGLSVVLHGLRLSKNDHIIATFHDHYTMHQTLNNLDAETERISLYEKGAALENDLIVNKILKTIRTNTKVIALTWVHSNTGVKLPLSSIYAAINKVNLTRSVEQKIIVVADGLHGLGTEYISDISQLGCDFFIAGTHKCFFGPRGTGIVWGRSWAWKKLKPIMTSFHRSAFLPWRYKDHQNDLVEPAFLCTPGGFPAFEHRWALAHAFKMHLEIGKLKISTHIKELTLYAKENLAKIPGIIIYTPLSPEHSSALICFDLAGLKAEILVQILLDYKILIGQTPYRDSCARLVPSIFNSREEIDEAIKIIRKIALERNFE